MGIYLLEHPDGIAKWRDVLATTGQGVLSVVHDVLLEAPVFAVNARELLDAVLPDLAASDGILLRRLLTRFLAFATIPNAEMVAVARSVGMDGNNARATYRAPYWPYWIGMLAFLHAHRSVVLRIAPGEIARVVEMWLSFAPKRAILRAETAELAVLLGRHALSTRDIYSGRESEGERERLYTCALAAAHERADDVATIALIAAERAPEAAPPTDSTLPRRRKARQRGLFGVPGAVRRPWPDGPRSRVDEAFQNVVLDGLAIRELYNVRPLVGREVVLATIIDAPREEGWDDNWICRMELDLVNRHKWFPALYIHGPFLMCLRDHFDEGVELIARLVEFAADRAGEHALLELNERRALAIADSQPKTEAAESMLTAAPRQIDLFDGECTRTYSGDERIYGWSAGIGNPPQAVEAALMALEQHFYQRLDGGEDVTEEIAAVLARSRSVALLGVLCDVAKRERALFEGPLRVLLSAPEIYTWEITKMVHGRAHLMIGARDKGEWFFDLARKFHGLEHRRSDLRHIAVSLLLQRQAMRDYFVRLREHWQSREAESDPVSDMTEQLVVALDPGNYQMREDPKHGFVLVNVEAERAQAARADELQAMNDRMMITSFPMRCRAILDEEVETER
ncbi:MAG: hypothetical protein IPH48_16515 [bacterium]|nr:hypothetical protein [bacterium]